MEPNMDSLLTYAWLYRKGERITVTFKQDGQSFTGYLHQRTYIKESGGWELSLESGRDLFFTSDQVIRFLVEAQ